MINRRLLELLKNDRKYIWLQLLFGWLSLACHVGLVYVLAYYLDAFYSRGMKINSPVLLLPAAAGVAAVLGAAFFKAKSTLMSHKAGENVKFTLRQAIFDKLLKLSDSRERRGKAAGISALTGEGVEQLEVYYGKFLPQLPAAVIYPLSLFFVIFPANKKGGLVFLIFGLLMPFALFAVRRVAKRLHKRYWGAYSSLSDSFLENLKGMTTLKIYGADGKAAEEMDREAGHFCKTSMKMQNVQLLSVGAMDLLAYGGAAAGMIYTLTQYYSSDISMRAAVMTVMLAMDFFGPLRNLGKYFYTSMNGLAAAGRIFELLDCEEGSNGTASFPEGKYDIEVRDLEFDFDDDTEVLNGVSFDIAYGDMISISGVSGSGKTTLAAIMAGRVKGYKGSIKIGGVELRDIPDEELFRYVTMVGSGAFILKGTVRDNLQMGGEGAGEEEMNLALELLKLNNELGLDDYIAEGGSNLSGGQKQRLALARALLHDTPILIIDEATSNIDMESEERIMAVIRVMSKKKTVLLISHRLSNLKPVAMIYHLKDGVIAEKGTFEELVRDGDEFRELYLTQKALERYAWDDEKEPGWKKELEEPESPKEEQVKEKAGEKAGPAKKYNSALDVILSMLEQVRPLAPVMVLAVIIGFAAYICQIGVGVIAGYGFEHYDSQLRAFLMMGVPRERAVIVLPFSVMKAMVVCACLTAVLGYIEKYVADFTAFKLVALMRHKVFDTMRKLCPAKLENKDKGEVISALTSDTEQLKAFFSHTVSPVVMAIVVSVCALVVMFALYPAAAVVALAGYCVAGIVIPVWNLRKNKENGAELKAAATDMNGLTMEYLDGLDEIVQYGYGGRMAEEMEAGTARLNKLKYELARGEAGTEFFTGLVTGLAPLLLIIFFGVNGRSDLITLMLLMGSFGAVSAVPDISGHLPETVEGARRLLKLIDEKPETDEVEGKRDISFSYGIEAENVSFSYGGVVSVLEDFSAKLPKGSITGIHGRSGSGKSTLLRLIMRFWDAEEGRIKISGAEIADINTKNLREMESYLTQDTFIFRDTIAANIAMGRNDATREEIEEAAGNASIHDFIMSLPDGYETVLGEGSKLLSDGEKQRLGLARAFLHCRDILLLDEPSSNLDAINEGIILKAIKECAGERTVVLVSHRRSTLRVADRIIEMEGES